MKCDHPRHPALKANGEYCCEEAQNAVSHDLYFEGLGKSGLELARQVAHEESQEDR